MMEVISIILKMDGQRKSINKKMDEHVHNNRFHADRAEFGLLYLIALCSRPAGEAERSRRLRRRESRCLTGHREPHSQTAFACTAHGAGQHRDCCRTLRAGNNGLRMPSAGCSPRRASQPANSPDKICS